MSSAISSLPRKRSRESTNVDSSPPVLLVGTATGTSVDAVASDNTMLANMTSVPPPQTIGKKKREIVQLAFDADIVLAQCRALKAQLRKKKEEAATATAAAVAAATVRTIPKSNTVVQRRGRSKVDDDDVDFAGSSSENDADDLRNNMSPKKTKNAGTAITTVSPFSDEIPSDIVEVDELSTTEVLEGIEGIALTITQQVLARKGFSMEVPSRAGTNQIYVKEWDRIVLGGKKTTRNFMNVRESRKSAITLRVMQLLHAVLTKRIHITKRDLFYTDVKLFVDQAESDGVLDDVATMIGCTRSNLHVVASDKGLVVGRIQFEEDGDPIDCTRMGVGGKAIPPYIDKIENIQSDAEFILLVEKEAAYMRMAVSDTIVYIHSFVPSITWYFLLFRILCRLTTSLASCCHSHRLRWIVWGSTTITIKSLGGSILSQVPMHRYYSQGSTGRCYSYVFGSYYQRIANPRFGISRFRPLRTQNLIGVYVG
jgi:hypothetical protein